MRVLVVVEDDPGMRVLIHETLSEDPRLEIARETGSLDEAIAQAAATEPNLVILDHFIEGSIMGLDAAPLIKAAAPRAKIILFTSHDLEVEASREPAIDAFLLKRHLDRLLPTAQRLLSLDTPGPPGPDLDP
ncbi:MAG: response regulator [Actinomycetota bacterium]